MAQAHKRLQRELQALQRDCPAGIHAVPLESDILQWHYVIEGPPASPYAGGFFHGLVRFPSEYPFKPPAVMVYTPSGRFATNTRICLSMSDFHPESWNPVWSVSSILVGVQSFLVETAPTAGSIESDDATKRDLAAKSLDWNIRNNRDFVRLFPRLVELRARQLADAAAAAAGGGAGKGGAGGGGGAGGAAAAAPAADAPPPPPLQAQRGGGGGAPLGPGNALALLALLAVLGAGLVLHLLTDSGAGGRDGGGDAL